MPHRRFERGLAVVGAAALLIIGFDSVTYASTGSSLLLGRVNRSAAVTTVQNTGKGAAVNLVTRSTSAPPFTTNAKGLVKNLYAARASNADKVGGLTVAQIKTATKGATGARGPAGSARAFGYVNLDGTLQFATPSTVKVTQPDGPMSGEFCITVPGVDPARSVIIAQPDEWAWVPSGAGVRLPWAHYSSRSGYCPAGAFLVETGTVAPGTEDYYGAVYHWNEPFVFMVA